MCADTKCMEWPASIAADDAVIVREETPDGLRFVVHSRRTPQFTCRTYAEAESWTLAYAARAHAHAWYMDKRWLLLVGPLNARPTPAPAVSREADARHAAAEREE